MRRPLMISTILAAALAVAAPAFADTTPTVSTTQAPAGQFERDRQSILAQAGQWRVRFDMRENVSFREGYEPLEEKLSAGDEIVRVVYDDGNRISLQHILVMDDDMGNHFIIKHWRQDWVYEPETVLTYAGPNQWTLTPVPADERRGAWSQTVWQTDDSPRYGGVGHWSYEHDMAEWTSGATWRPLARRDAIRDVPYDRYLGSNRHALTPVGWVHIQDNMKMGPAQGDEGEPVAIVQEDVVNTYRKVDNYDPKPGDDYWAATKDYWAGVRAAWDERIVASGGLYLEEEANRGAVTGKPLMDWAEEVQAGTLTTEAAIARARDLIARATVAPTH
ncbi:DUF6607 family protein [Brevundimonas lenta]|uniref:Secreted protein n=1 Tax=Brevundimonas lenta TaxID=424796 RepID=A0A7W6NPA5_9CAUL|nr:DUF6607 family protein [Brevundimonas lenta]MBB4082309.1 hypothetical protein [Brevundimonas lenta]